MSNSPVINNLLQIVGEDNVFTESGMPELGCSQPLIVVQPGNVEQVSEILKLASGESLAVIPRGSGTKSGLGNNLDRADIVLSTKRLNRVIEHAASDLTATVESGVTLGNFLEELGKENQFLPIDCPNRDATTVGGMISAHSSGSLRLKYGTARELLIGLRVVRADGSIFKGGSKVVKNVAGYDIPKLFVGSLGTLGIITEATFRLYPVPEYSESCLGAFESAADCREAAASLLKSDLVLTSLDQLDANLMERAAHSTGIDVEPGNYYLAARIMNVEQVVKAQISEIRETYNKNGGKCMEINGENDTGFWEEIREFTVNIATSGSAVCKAGVTLTDVRKVFSELEHVSKIQPVKTYVSAKAGNGILNILFEGEAEALKDSIHYIRKFCYSVGGHLVVERAPESVKTAMDVWGDLGSGKALLKRIKYNFDPDDMLNPGRYV